MEVAHRVEWWLRRGQGIDPVGVIRCDGTALENPDCWIDPENPDESFGECHAAHFINGLGVGAQWAGEGDIPARPGAVEVWWDGADWLWCYTVERRAVVTLYLPELSVADETVAP